MATWREIYPLESIKPLKKTIGTAILLIFIAVIATIFISLSSSNLSSILAVIWIGVIFLIVINYVYQVYYMKLYFYDSTKNTIIIKKGVFAINEINIPYNRLQDVYVDQDILDRIFGLYDVHVSSATFTSAFLSHIDGLNKENAEKVKKLILDQIHK